MSSHTEETASEYQREEEDVATLPAQVTKTPKKYKTKQTNSTDGFPKAVVAEEPPLADRELLRCNLWFSRVRSAGSPASPRSSAAGQFLKKGTKVSISSSEGMGSQSPSSFNGCWQLVYTREKRNLRSPHSSPCRRRSERPVVGGGRLLAITGWMVPRQLTFVDTSGPGPRNWAAGSPKAGGDRGRHSPPPALGEDARGDAPHLYRKERPWPQRPQQVMPGRRTAPPQSAPTWRRRAGRLPLSLARAPLAHRAPLPQLEPRARSLTSRRLLLFRRHRRSHPADSAAPGPAAWRAPGSPCAGPGGGPGVRARAHAGLCPVPRRPPLQPPGARPAESAERAAGIRPLAGVWAPPDRGREKGTARRAESRRPRPAPRTPAAGGKVRRGPRQSPSRLSGNRPL